MSYVKEAVNKILPGEIAIKTGAQSTAPAVTQQEPQKILGMDKNIFLIFSGLILIYLLTKNKN